MCFVHVRVKSAQQKEKRNKQKKKVWRYQMKLLAALSPKCSFSRDC